MNAFMMAVISVSKSYRDLDEEVTILGTRVKVARRIRPLEKAIFSQIAMSMSCDGIDLKNSAKEGIKKDQAFKSLDILLKEKYQISVMDVAERIPAEYGTVHRAIKKLKKWGILDSHLNLNVNRLDGIDAVEKERKRREKYKRLRVICERDGVSNKELHKGGRPAVRFTSISEKDDFKYLIRFQAVAVTSWA